MRFAPAVLSCPGVGEKMGNRLLAGGGLPTGSFLSWSLANKGGYGILFLLSVSETVGTQRLAFSSQTGEYPLAGALTPEVAAITHWPRKGLRGISDAPRVCAECSVCAFFGRECLQPPLDSQSGVTTQKSETHRCGVGASPWATVWSRAGPMGSHGPAC